MSRKDLLRFLSKPAKYASLSSRNCTADLYQGPDNTSHLRDPEYIDLTSDVFQEDFLENAQISHSVSP
jgi:hypothetical protein